MASKGGWDLRVEADLGCGVMVCPRDRQVLLPIYACQLHIYNCSSSNPTDFSLNDFTYCARSHGNWLKNRLHWLQSQSTHDIHMRLFYGAETMHEMGTLPSDILISRVWTETSNRLHIEYRIGPFYDSNSILSMIKERISAFHRHDCSPTLKLIYLPIITRHNRWFTTSQVTFDTRPGFV
jgi:hypothetical protein